MVKPLNVEFLLTHLCMILPFHKSFKKHFFLGKLHIGFKSIVSIIT